MQTRIFNGQDRNEPDHTSRTESESRSRNAAKTAPDSMREASALLANHNHLRKSDELLKKTSQKIMIIE
jgi:hypothetical protein